MIHVLWPTVRPRVALQRAAQWLERASDPSRVQIMFGVNTDEHLQEIMTATGLVKDRSVWMLFRDCSPGVTATATKLTQLLVKDFNASLDRSIIVLASDDFEAPQGWDEFLLSQFKDFDGMLIADDRPGTNIIAIPILHGKCLKRLNGVIYNPSYSHFYSDQELYYTCQELGLSKDVRSGPTLFSHHHWTFNKRDRDLNDMRNTEWWEKDKANYEARKDWPVEQKLALPEGWK